VLLRLFEQRSERLTHVGQTQLVGLAETLPIPLELLLLEMQISFEGTTRVCGGRDAPHGRGRLTTEESHLGGKDPGVVELLSEVLDQFVDRAHELRTGHGRDMKVVLDNRLVLGTEILVEEVGEFFLIHRGFPFSRSGTHRISDRPRLASCRQFNGVHGSPRPGIGIGPGPRQRVEIVGVDKRSVHVE
jgi:hypothetical protein